MENIKLENVNVRALIKYLDKVYEAETDENERSDIAFGIDRLESMKKGDKFVMVDNLGDLGKGYKIEDGYWTINGKAHYICKQR